jgi:hypothetical protein
MVYLSQKQEEKERMHFTGGRGHPHYCRLFGQNQYFKLDVIKPTHCVKKPLKKDILSMYQL